MILFKMVTDIPNNACHFIYFDDEYISSPVYYLVDNFKATFDHNLGTIVSVKAEISAALFDKTKGFVKNDLFTMAMSSTLYEVLIDASIKLYTASYFKVGESRVH